MNAYSCLGFICCLYFTYHVIFDERRRRRIQYNNRQMFGLLRTERVFGAANVWNICICTHSLSEGFVDNSWVQMKRPNWKKPNIREGITNMQQHTSWTLYAFLHVLYTYSISLNHQLKKNCVMKTTITRNLLFVCLAFFRTMNFNNIYFIYDWVLFFIFRQLVERNFYMINLYKIHRQFRWYYFNVIHTHKESKDHSYK